MEKEDKGGQNGIRNSLNGQIYGRARAIPSIFLNATSLVVYHPALSVTVEHLVRPLSHFENLIQS